ncbi:Serine/threonine-protein kinase AfsK [Actinomadura rubteroloni]|uniref:Serine/threonine-protein kinase AfsK n=1 Tax=Actinomadura rubteroloni TaxID=1926885 RepID=A0A2P4UMB7_9ACTN|nr:serine/threonine-protein kinase [Actinomadura rubteroloni]POM26192.1 Serine/threonine-protein kinase AfsK [Actinomadura rubteroloni]
MEPLHPGDPRQIGPYRLEARLGAGGMGQVFLGVSPGARRVAVKVVRAEYAEDERFRQRFAREVEAARRVGGFHTAQVVDADPAATSPWLVTAFIPGPSLRQVVGAQGPLDAAAVRALAAGLAEGLAAIHACGLVHRDLKPGNVIMAADGPRIIDFGIARATDATVLTSHNVVVGTYAYMAPEQVSGAPAGPSADVFSLGCVLAYAALGQGPFDATSIPAIVHRVLHEEPDLSALPADLRNLIAACLAKDPARRPTVDTLMHAPQSIVAPAPSFLPPEDATFAHATMGVTRSVPAPAPVRRRALLIGAGAAVAALAVGVPAAVLLTGDDGEPAAPPPAPNPTGLISASGSLTATDVKNLSEIALSPDDRTVAAGGLDEMITLWDVASRRVLRTIKRAGWVSALAFSPDGASLASSASNAGSLLIWDAATGAIKVNARTGDQFGLNAVAYSPDGSVIAGVNPGAHLFDPGTGRTIASADLGNSGVNAVAFSPDGALVAVAVDGYYNKPPGNTVQLFDGRRLRKVHQLIGHSANVTGVTFSPDGKLLVSSAADSTVRIWDTNTYRTKRILKTEAATVRDVKFSPDGKTLFGACSDRTVRVWDTATGALSVTLVGHAQAVDRIALTRDGRTVAGVGTTKPDGSVTLWKV